MVRIGWIRIGLAGLLFSATLAAATCTARTQQAVQSAAINQVAHDLTHAERDRRIQGLNAYVRVPLEARTEELKSALIQSLELELDMGRAIATSKIPPLPWDNNHDFRFGLVSEILTLKDPDTIPVLVRTINMAGSVAASLADFGRLALPTLVACIDGQQPALEKTIDIVLITLRIMVQRNGLNYFNPQERVTLRSIAHRFLDLKPGEFPTDTEIVTWQESDEFWRAIRLGGAMQLAWVLNEPVLREKVTAIATDPEALRERGLNAKQVRYLKGRFERIRTDQPMLPTYSSMIRSSDQQ